MRVSNRQSPWVSKRLSCPDSRDLLVRAKRPDENPSPPSTGSQTQAPREGLHPLSPDKSSIPAQSIGLLTNAEQSPCRSQLCKKDRARDACSTAWERR